MKNKKLILSISLACGIFIIILLFDLLSKHYITQELEEVGQSKDFLPGFINFIYIQNTGAAWGMLAGRPVFLIIVSLIILGFYIWFYISRLKKLQNRTSITLAISVGLIVGGCIGNLVDRIAFGYVRDFINFQFMDFPVFNIADIALTIGIIIMVIYFIFIYTKEDKNLQMIHQQAEEFKNLKDLQSLDREIKISEKSLEEVTKNTSQSNEEDINYQSSSKDKTQEEMKGEEIAPNRDIKSQTNGDKKDKENEG